MLTGFFDNKTVAGSSFWYSHIPKSVTEHEDITVLWKQGAQTDREFLSSKEAWRNT
jgi:hypothetical protein